MLIGERDEGFIHYLRQCPSAGLPVRISRLARRQEIGVLRPFSRGGAGTSCRRDAGEAGPGVLAHCILPCAGRGVVPYQHFRTSGPHHSRASLHCRRYDRYAEYVKQSPVFLFRKKDAGDELPLQFQLWDNDSVFLGSLGPEFLT